MPRLPRKVPRRHRRAQARHQSQPSAISATPATQDEGRCLQVPRLPRKTKMDVSKCHACHVKRRWMSPSATPATQSAAASPATKRAQARHQSHPSAISAMPATQNEGGCPQAPRMPRETKVCRDKELCDRWWLTKLCVKHGGDKDVCERWCVTKLCVTDGS